uniref:Uncharacterized protein LOC113787721 n=1 Tax=Cicer arietinum TaxID=3827 RepID=A0A3Q7YGQ3_CICAR|nr:uncharacterized protein LOC113787721 [Cicer arietinum]
MSWTLGWVDRSVSGVHRLARPFCWRCAPGLNWPSRTFGAVTLKKLECSKQDYGPIVLAFGIGVMINRDSRGRTTAKTFAKDVFINQERKLGARRRSDTVLVSTINDADQGSADVAFRTPLAPYEKSKSLGSGGSMVARLKLKGIDGRAPPGVEPALFLDSMGGGAWPFLVGGAICLVNSVNERDLSLLNSYVEVTLHGQLLRGTMAIIAIVGLKRGIPSKRESSARVDYVPALCTHRPSLLPIEWSGEVFGLRRRGRFAARDVVRSPLNLII